MSTATTAARELNRRQYLWTPNGNLKIGVIGAPNVGKSLLFNLLAADPCRHFRPSNPNEDWNTKTWTGTRVGEATPYGMEVGGVYAESLHHSGIEDSMYSEEPEWKSDEEELLGATLRHPGAQTAGMTEGWRRTLLESVSLDITIDGLPHLDAAKNSLLATAAATGSAGMFYEQTAAPLRDLPVNLTTSQPNFSMPIPPVSDSTHYTNNSTKPPQEAQREENSLTSYDLISLPSEMLSHTEESNEQKINRLTGRITGCQHWSLVDNTLFTTTDPVIGIFCPYDIKFATLSRHYAEKEQKHLKVTLIDCPGIVEGSFLENRGLGTESLSVLQSVDVLYHVLRGFESADCVSYDEERDVLRDLISTEKELMMLDLYRIDGQLVKLEAALDDILSLSNFHSSMKQNFSMNAPGEGGSHEMSAEYLQYQYVTLLKVWEFLAGAPRPIPPKTSKKAGILKRFYVTKMPRECQGRLIRLGSWDHHERDVIQPLRLITAKEMIYIMNLSQINYIRSLRMKTETPKAATATLSSPTAAEASSSLPSPSANSSSSFSDKRDYLTSITGIERFLQQRNDPCPVIRLSLELEQQLFLAASEEGPNAILEYQYANPSHKFFLPLQILHETNLCLNLITYYTIDDKHVRKWMVRQGTTLVEAVIRHDIDEARVLQRCCVINFEQFDRYNGDMGKLQSDGKIRHEGRKYVLNEGDLIDLTKESLASSSHMGGKKKKS